MKSYKSVFLSILSAGLLTLSFPNYNLWSLAWIALVPFFAAIRKKGTAEAAFLSFLTGTVFNYCLIYWMSFVAVMATMALVFYLALYFVLFGIYARVCLARPIPIILKCALLAAFWAVLEYIRTNLFTGFGWGLLGYSQAPNLAVIQIADITGVYGVSFLVVFVNVAIYEFFFQEKRHSVGNGVISKLLYNKLINLFLVLIIVFICLFYGFYKLNSSLVPRPSSHVPLRVCVIQGNIPQLLKWDESYREEILNKYLRLTKAALDDNPDLIIWPETAYPYLEPDFDSLSGISKDVANDIYYLIGANRFVPESEDDKWIERLFNSAILVDNKGKITDVYDKLRLVPFGEYMPFVIPQFLLKFLPEKINMVGNFSRGRDFKVFKLKAHSPRHTASFSALICFEDIFPYLSRTFVKNGARFLVNITNDAWFGPTAAPYQHAQASVFRAVENRCPVVRCANTGLSVFIDSAGRIYEAVKSKEGKEIFVEGHKTAEVALPEYFSLTFYNKYGNIFAYLSILLVGTSLLSFSYRKTRGPSSNNC